MIKRRATIRYEGRGGFSIFDVRFKRDGTKVQMHYSPLDKEWAYPEKLAYEIRDTGNCLIAELAGLTHTLSYADEEELRIMLNLRKKLQESKSGGGFPKSTLTWTKIRKRRK